MSDVRRIKAHVALHWGVKNKAAQTIFRVVAHRKQRVKCLAQSEESMNVCVFKCGREKERD